MGAAQRGMRQLNSINSPLRWQEWDAKFPKDHPYIHTSRFRVIQKSTPGKWRLIADTSSPEGGSVNDGIQDLWCSLSHITVTNATHGITSYGRGALMIRVDIHYAYGVILIHPADRWLMGMTWEGSVFINTAFHSA